MITKINVDKCHRQYLTILSVFFFGFFSCLLQAADNRLVQKNNNLVLGPIVDARSKTNDLGVIKKYVIYKRLLKDQTLLKKIPSKRVMEYKDRFIISLDSKNIKKLPKDLRDVLIVKPKYSRIIVNGKYIDTTRKAPAVPDELQQQKDTNKRLLYIQFPGPIKAKWKKTVSKLGIKIVSYVRHNALLVYTDRKALKSALENPSLLNLIQWVSPHHPAYKIDNSFSNEKVLRKVYGKDINKVVAVIQLFNNSEVDKTIKRIEQQSNKILHQYPLGQYINLHVSIDRNRINSIAHNGDVVYISLHIPSRTGGERQGLILTNKYNLASTDPLPVTKGDGDGDGNADDYLAWIEAKLTTSCASAPATNCVNPFNFILDITDHPIDLGSTAAGNLHNVFEDSSGSSRVLYQNLVDTALPLPASGDTIGTVGDYALGDIAGHGTFAAAVAGGYPNGDANTNGYRHGLGIAPFAWLGSTQKTSVFPSENCGGAAEDLEPIDCEVLFSGNQSAVATGTAITSPPWRTEITAAYNNTAGGPGVDGARISSNSWGTGDDFTLSVGRYSYVSQMADIMTRDVDTVAGGNQEMLFVFLAGNITTQGNSTLWNEGSTAKNTLVVGGTRTHNPRGGTACGNSDADAAGIDEFYTKTSWGPTLGVEPRIKPDLVAPASRIHSAITQQTNNTFLAGADDGYPFTKQGICSDEDYFPAGGQTLYMQASGTSFAAPAVAGMAANLRHWLMDVKQQPAPSPALLKAWLMNSSLYVSSATDADPLPSKKQGMGRADQERALDDVTRLYRNQNVTLDDSSTTSFTLTGRVTNKDEPLRFTLAWTDLPTIMTDGGLVNDLDLQISLTHAGATSHYQGNSYIAAPVASQTNADSISHTSAAMATMAQDDANNVESITIAADDLSTAGIEELSVGDVFTITVTGESFGGDAIAGTSGGANAQDFSLVVYNGALTTSANTGLNVELGDSGVTIGNSLLMANAPDDSSSATDIVYTITDVPNATEGTLNHSIDGVLAIDSMFTQDDIDNSRISFTSNAANTGGTDTNFGFLISDSRGDINLSNAPAEEFSIIINAPTDADDVTTCAFGDNPVAIPLTGSDPDVDDNTLTMENISTPIVGTLRETAAPASALITGASSFNYGDMIYYHPPVIAPPGSFTEPAPQPSFTFEVNDGVAGTTNATGTVNINVTLSCRTPIDLALVLDFSGSMNQMLGSDSRVQEMQDSVRLFVDTWRMNQPDPADGNDNIGLVTYNSTAQIFMTTLHPLETATPADIDAVEVLDEMCDPLDGVGGIDCDRDGGGGTAMGLGLMGGYNLLSASPNTNRFIVLLTDGMQNISPIINDGGGSFNFSPDTGVTSANFNTNTITVHTLGIGSTIGSTFLDTLENISDSTPGGVTHNTDNATEALPDMWQNTLVESLDANSLEMVGHDSGVFTMADQRTGKKHSYHLNKSARKATFVLYWKGDRRKDALQIALRHKPSGTFIPASTNGLRKNDKSFYSIRHLDFPITLPDGTNLSAEGEWEIFINGKLAVDSVNYQTWVMAEDDAVKYDFAIPKRLWSAGELVKFISAITDKKGKSIIKKVIEAKVNISAPSIGLGTFVAINKIKRSWKMTTNSVTSLRSNLTVIDNQIKQLNLDPDSFNNAANKKLLLLLRDPDLKPQLQRKFTTLDLKPTQQGTSIAGFDKTKIPGSYTVNISVKAIGIDGSIIQRTRRFSMRVTMDTIDRKNSFINVTRTKINSGNLQVQITPIDKYGNYLGPGLANKLTFNAKGVEKIGLLVDNLDGSYTQNFMSKNLFGDTIKLKVLDTELIIETRIDPRIYWFIIFILLLLVIFALYKLLKKQP